MGRLYSVLHLRKFTLNYEYLLNKLVFTYFRHDWRELTKHYNEQPLIFDGKATILWLQEHSGADEKLKASIKLLAGELSTQPISNIKIHLKLESLLKTEPI